MNKISVIVGAVIGLITAIATPVVASIFWVQGEHEAIESRALNAREEIRSEALAAANAVDQRLLEDQIARLKAWLSSEKDPSRRAELLKEIEFKLRELCGRYPQSWDCRRG